MADPDRERREEDPSFQQEMPGYAQVRGESDDEIERAPQTELDPLNYPPPPPGYFQRGQPTRITRFAKLLGVLVVIGTACFLIAAVIDVSSPSDRFQPGVDEQSVADSVLAAMDRSADPCENFYEYACGSWMRLNSIPSDRTRYTKSFGVVYDMTQLMLREILEADLEKDVTPSKPRLFYASCLDQMGTGGLNTLYFIPLRDDFNHVDNAVSFAKLLAKLHSRGSGGLFDVDIDLDAKDPTTYALYLGQGGLGLPHRDNYFSMKDSDVQLRQKYVALMVAMLGAAGKARLIPRRGHELLAEQILHFETVLANASLPPENLRDPETSYNKVYVSKLPSVLSIGVYLDTFGIDRASTNGTVVLDNPQYFDRLARVMQQLNEDVTLRRVVRGYLAFHFVRQAASNGLIGEALYHENFKFKQFIYGMKQLPEKWKTCQSLTSRYLGEALGAEFVKKHFTSEQENIAKTLAGEVAKAFSERLQTLEWMDAPTRAAATDKLSAINWKVGYSKKLDTYDDVVISVNSYANNVESSTRHSVKKNLERLGKPVDPTEWFMKPYEVNAYYSPTRNEMVFPAGILQQPFFSDAYPDAMNYGAIGAVIGHEMSHGFDDQGRKYDKTGSLTSWWSESSAAKYDEKAQCYIDLYDTYKPRDVDIHVRGNLTLGENLADTNGVNNAYHAFKKIGNNSESGAPPPNALLARELTNDQLFFVAYAQTWCSLYRPEALKVQMMTNPHSPGQFRVQGPLSQNPDFAAAFSCRKGSRYYPEHQCSLW